MPIHEQTMPMAVPIHKPTSQDEGGGCPLERVEIHLYVMGVFNAWPHLFPPRARCILSKCGRKKCTNMLAGVTSLYLYNEVYT